MNIEDLEVAEWEWVYTVYSPEGKRLGAWKQQMDAEAALDGFRSQAHGLGLPELTDMFRVTRRKRAVKFWIDPEEEV